MDELRECTQLKSSNPDLDHFKKDGVFHFKHVLDDKTMHLMTTEVNAIRAMVMKKISLMQRPIKKYSDIVERELGRLDYRCGFTSPIFDEIATIIIQLIKLISPCIDFRYYWGAIPSLAGAGPTSLHRDIYSIVNTTQGENLDQLDVNLPPYYLTVLMPLVKITEENGPTQFIKGSHLKLIVDEHNKERYTPLPAPGDILIFDGRILHRGLANQSNQERIIAYMTFVANWYHDQTFAINEYLFSG